MRRTIGETWEPSDKLKLFLPSPPEIKFHSLSVRPWLSTSSTLLLLLNSLFLLQTTWDLYYFWNTADDSLCLFLLSAILHHCGPGSSVGIATELWAGRSGIESRWERDFSPVQTGPGTHPASCKMGTGSFPGVKSGRGVLLTTHLLLVPRSWKSRAMPLPTLWATPGLQRDHFTFFTLHHF